MRKLTKQEILEKCASVHNEAYLYDEASLTSLLDLATITCQIHGQFKQLLRDHIHKKSGCPKCGVKKRNGIRSSDREEFITKALQAHQGFYSYEKSCYVNSRTKIIITCPEHGDFQQLPADHVRGFKCKQCGNAEVSKRLISNVQEFTEKAKSIHHDFYDYSKIEYVKNNVPISIICPNHGEFLQTPAAHLRGQKCPKHAKEIVRSKRISNTQKFIDKATLIHNHFYDYSKVDYKIALQKVVIICPKHGDFYQKPGAHLFGQNCPKCVSSISKKETSWLDNLKIKNRNVTIRLRDRHFNVDGFDPTTNTIYEFYGDYWHGNPKVYHADAFNGRAKTTFGELYNKTLMREKLLLEAGYNLVSIWEHDFK